MSPDDWFRRTTWTDEDRVDFMARLGRARKCSRPQYLRIQAVHLAGVDTHPAALELLDHFLQVDDGSIDLAQARQFITKKLADALPASRRGPLFELPSEFDMADKIRADLAKAREIWLDEVGEEGSDFLLPVNHAGERFDFHSLRHTCGAWLALRNVHVKTIQEVMRHSSITLTLDTYGHLFPDAAEDAIDKLGEIFDGA